MGNSNACGLDKCFTSEEEKKNKKNKKKGKKGSISKNLKGDMHD